MRVHVDSFSTIPAGPAAAPGGKTDGAPGQ